MSSKSRFTVLLVSDELEDLKSLCTLVKRHFSLFFIAKNEEEALKIIVEKNIDVLLMGLSSLQASEVCYLHLLSAKKNIERILFRKIVFCSRDELKEAFNICNKDVFDDYFVVRPLYDPYHLLLRLRFIRRIKDNRDPTASQAFSLDDLCNYFDQVVNCQDSVTDLNAYSYEKLLSIVSFSMDKMKQKIFTEGDLHAQQQSQIGTLIDNHTENSLIKNVSEHQKETQERIQENVQGIADIAKLKKQRAVNPEPAAFTESNILLIEDDEVVRDNMKHALDAAGYAAQISGSATHAIQLMRTWKPDIVMIDLTLPDMSPLYVINTIQTDPGMQHSRILVLAKEGDKDNAEEAMRQGVHEIMRKPVDRDMLLYKVDYNLKALKKEES